MISNKDDISQWSDDLEGFKPEYLPVKVKNILQFFRLIGRRTVLSKNNIEPIPELSYCIFSPKENRYYVKLYRGYSLTQIYFYRKDLDFSGEDTAVENLRKYVDDRNVYLLLTNEQIRETSSMLQRIWNANRSDEGTLSYKIYLQILDISLQKEDYAENHRELTGYLTVIKIYEEKIRDLWLKAIKN